MQILHVHRVCACGTFLNSLLQQAHVWQPGFCPNRLTCTSQEVTVNVHIPEVTVGYMYIIERIKQQ